MIICSTIHCCHVFQLEGVDVEAALERYASRGDWQKAIAIAEKKVRHNLSGIVYGTQYTNTLFIEDFHG